MKQKNNKGRESKNKNESSQLFSVLWQQHCCCEAGPLAFMGRDYKPKHRSAHFSLNAYRAARSVRLVLHNGC